VNKKEENNSGAVLHRQNTTTAPWSNHTNPTQPVHLLLPCTCLGSPPFLSGVDDQAAGGPLQLHR